MLFHCVEATTIFRLYVQTTLDFWQRRFNACYFLSSFGVEKKTWRSAVPLIIHLFTTWENLSTLRKFLNSFTVEIQILFNRFFSSLSSSFIPFCVVYFFVKFRIYFLFTIRQVTRHYLFTDKTVMANWVRVFFYFVLYLSSNSYVRFAYVCDGNFIVISKIRSSKSAETVPFFVYSLLLV